MHTTITVESGPTEGSRHSLSGASRHSRWIRSTITAPGISPSAARFASGRMSTTSAPASCSSLARAGPTRTKEDRAAASLELLHTFALLQDEGPLLAALTGAGVTRERTEELTLQTLEEIKQRLRG